MRRVGNHKPHSVFLKTMTKLKNLIRRMERGDAGSEFAFITYTPFLMGLLIIGIFFGMLGFWRVGAGYANLVTSQKASVASESSAETTQRTLFGNWTNASTVSSSVGGVGFQEDDRFIVSSFDINRTFEFSNFGPWAYEVNSQIQSRLERFFPGAPKCDGDGCNE